MSTAINPDFFALVDGELRKYPQPLENYDYFDGIELTGRVRPDDLDEYGRPPVPVCYMIPMPSDFKLGNGQDERMAHVPELLENLRREAWYEIPGNKGFTPEYLAWLAKWEARM